MAFDLYENTFYRIKIYSDEQYQYLYYGGFSCRGNAVRLRAIDHHNLRKIRYNLSGDIGKEKHNAQFKSANGIRDSQLYGK